APSLSGDGARHRCVRYHRADVPLAPYAQRTRRARRMDRPARPTDGRMKVAVVGLGAMGSAVAYHLARSGAEVVGFDRYRPPHTMGSSHGETRIIRAAYSEGAAYVPLVLRAYELWEQLERSAGRPLLQITGGLYLDASGEAIASARRSADSYAVEYESPTAGEVARRFPGLRPDDEFEALYEPRAGVLSVEPAVEAQLSLAAREGADLRFETAVQGWAASASGVTLATSGGAVSADARVLAAGPWLPSLLGDSSVPLTVERQVAHWFAAGDAGAGERPISIWHPSEGPAFYALPERRDAPGSGVKIALHHGGVETDPESVEREVAPGDIAALRDAVVGRIAEASGSHLRAEVRLYTNTPDEDFVIDRHPEHEQVLIVSPCSGHGFKFAPAVGGGVSEWLLEGAPAVDLSAFSAERFA
ncbi:MAG: N-methyl-L-tryptophan oxidase, partial [Dehalococcoidia bacterium]